MFHEYLRIMAVLVLFLATQLAVGQAGSADLTGVVWDSGGALLPGAKITALDTHRRGRAGCAQSLSAADGAGNGRTISRTSTPSPGSECSGPMSWPRRICRRTSAGQRTGSTPVPFRLRRSLRWAVHRGIRYAGPITGTRTLRSSSTRGCGNNLIWNFAPRSSTSQIRRLSASPTACWAAAPSGPSHPPQPILA